MGKETYQTLFTRDLNKLSQEIAQYPDENLMWRQLPGTINSGGNLCQHLIGNLRTYVGLTLGGFAYVRDRDAEFSSRNFTRAQLLAELDKLKDIIAETIDSLDEQELVLEYPREVLDMFPEQSTNLILQHLLTHLSYHLGQINYHRRAVSASQSSLE